MGLQTAVDRYLAMVECLRKRDNKYHLYLQAEDRLKRATQRLDDATGALSDEEKKKYASMVATFEKERKANA